MLILPVGVTKGTVEGVLRAVEDRLTCVITVSTPGFEDVKEEIILGVGKACELMGVPHYHLVIGMGDLDASARLYSLLKKSGAGTVIVSGVTGSRFLLPIIMQSVLRYWYDTRSEILLVHGIEGEGWSIQPLVGFLTFRLKRVQKELFKIIYEHPGDRLRTREDLIVKHGLSRTAYKVLKELESKGLIRTGRNRIEKTLPGYLLFNLLKEAGDI